MMFTDGHPGWRGEEIVYEVKTGSRLYGLHDQDSDADVVSVFIESPRDLLGVADVKDAFQGRSGEKIDGADVDRKVYSLRKLCKLIAKGSPSAFELLFVPEEAVLIDRGGYHAALRKLAPGLITAPVIKHYLGFVKGHRKRTGSLGFEKRRMHAARALLDAFEMMKTGGLVFPYEVEKREGLLDIRHGRLFLFDTWIEMVEDRMKDLPQERNTDAIDEFLVKSYRDHWEKSQG